MIPGHSECYDVMQVCRNGHVVTDRLLSDPSVGRYCCDRCGASTLSRCATCGRVISAPARAVGVDAIGSWPPPRHCAICGSAFPWAREARKSLPAYRELERLLTRLPLAIRQLSWRQGRQPPFCINDEGDLEDLLRSLLPLLVDDIRPESRTPSYSQRTKTDFYMALNAIAVTSKLALAPECEKKLVTQAEEDVAYYKSRGGCKLLVIYVYDPKGCLRDREWLATACVEMSSELELRLIA